MLTLWIVSGISERIRPGFIRAVSGKLTTGAVSLVIAFVPLQGLSFADCILSLVPVASVGTIALFISILWRRFSGEVLLSESNMEWFALWNVLLGLFLYASALGFVEIDLYQMGYDFSVLFVVVATVTVVLLVSGSPLGYLFVIYIAAYNLDLLLSPNYFDYMIDAVLFFASLGILIVRSFSRVRGRIRDRAVAGAGI